MNKNEAVNEIIKRYKYLYNNKELILAMCIRKEYCKKNKKEEYYLSKYVEKEIVDAYKEFILTNLEMETTILFKHIEALKNHQDYYDAVTYSIELLEERRKKDNNLKSIPTFTVWKILTYIRNNTEDIHILNALDIYYNLDRYILTGLDWDSGYSFITTDFDKYNDKLSTFDICNLYPSSIIKKRNENDDKVMNFNNNNDSVEEEDKYFEINELNDYKYITINEKNDLSNKRINTKFLKILNNFEKINKVEKEKLYNELCYKKMKKIKKTIREV